MGAGGGGGGRGNLLGTIIMASNKLTIKGTQGQSKDSDDDSPE